jgi:putative acyl-CoA dehydrogenase
VTDANQSPPLFGTDAFAADPLLQALAPADPELGPLGLFVRSEQARELARAADINPPRLATHDRQGNRIDRVTFHPAYHALMARSTHLGLHSLVWEPDAGDVAHQRRAARFYLMAQLECGHLCPITMTSAALAALYASPVLFARWRDRVCVRNYDPSHLPAAQKTGVTIGMGMTERQGGTDVRANTTRAMAVGTGRYAITGHKWFMSAPMCDAFLVLAQADEGLSCFLVPRIRSDGAGNGLRFERLKDKLGNRSNASTEVTFDAAEAEMVGIPGAGIRTIMDMVALTRLDCALASAALMRAGLSEAVHHARHRRVFGTALIDRPLMANVLADMALDVAAATALAFRLARALDDGEHGFARILTPVAKYWVCKIAPALLYEAMECLGGNGYVEDFDLARYYREAPVNAIWEGSGNVMVLDLQRVLEKSPDALAAYSIDPTLPPRALIERVAVTIAAQELDRLVPVLAPAFRATRLHGPWRSTYGTLPADIDHRAIVDALYPGAAT